jgi:hypothetical protein
MTLVMPSRASPLNRLLASQRVEFGGYVRSLGRAYPLEHLVRLPQPGLRSRRMPGGQVTAAQASQRVRLIPGAVDLPGDAQGLGVIRRRGSRCRRSC